MNILILLLSLVAVSFSADKWEYLIGKHQMSYGLEGFAIAIQSGENYNLEKEIYSKYETIMTQGIQGHPIIKALKLLGEDGWELVDVKAFNDMVTFYYFKR